MKILIIGGTSSLGYALKPVLSEFSEVITAGRNNCDLTLDLSDPIEKISFPNDIDAIVHTATHFGGKSVKEIVEAESINVVGTLKLCHAAVQAKAKLFVLISSMIVFVKEDSEYYGIYALSKKHSEEVARYLCSCYSLPLAILRPSQIYGNQDSFRAHQPFIYTMVDKAEKGEDITIYGSNDAQRNYIHIDDLTMIVAKVIQKKAQGIFSCMYSTDLTYSQIAKAALSAFHSKGTVYFDKEKADIPDNIFEKDDSLYKIIDYYPQITIEEGMKRIALYRSSHE